MSALVKRTLTGIVYISLIVCSILFTNWAFPVLCTIFALLGMIEYDKLTRDVGQVSGKTFSFDMIFILLIMLAPIFGLTTISITLLMFYPMLRLCLQLYLKSETPIVDSAKSTLLLAWIVLPLFLLSVMMCSNPDNAIRQFLLVMFIMIWLNDTGAFCAGSLFGRTKLFERISPKKTWEGFAGGFILTAVFGYFSPLLFTDLRFSEHQMLIYGLCVSIVATFGDLIESMFKQALHIKDSGHLLPGHGGILDRIDSLLLVAIFSVWFSFVV